MKEVDKYGEEHEVDIQEILELTKEEAQTLWNFLMREPIPYEAIPMRDVVYKLRKFIESIEKNE